MKYRFFTLKQAENALRLSEKSIAPQTDAIFRPTRLEQMIFEDAGGDAENKALTELFHLLYASEHRPTEADLRFSAANCRAAVVNMLQNQPEYGEFRRFCAGNDFVAMEAAKMLAQTVSKIEKHLMDALGKLPMVLSRLYEKQNRLYEKVQSNLAKVQNNNTELPEILHSAEQLASVAEQIGVVRTMLSDTLRKQLSQEETALQTAAQESLETAQTAAYASACWSSESGSGTEKAQQNQELLRKLKENDYLRDIARQLGRMKEVLSALRKNGYAHGRGEKFSLTRGRDLKNLLSGELALLASPATMPLFLRRYNAKGLMQYAKREKVRKGGGDVIVCLDESGSTGGENAAWGKALAFAVQDICSHEGRKFALIHFSSKSSIRTDRFLPGQFTENDLLTAAEHFFDGGTNFEAPLTEALRLIHEEEFSNADILFITDGYCDISDNLAEQLQAEISVERCSVIGLLMDEDTASNTFSLEKFCEKTFRVRQFDHRDIEQKLLDAFMPD